MDGLSRDLRAATERRLRERGVNGLAVCAFDADGIRFADAVGLADAARGEPVSVDTIFRVASISKLVTATLLLALSEAGLVDLDRPFNDHLPAQLRIADHVGRPATSTTRTLLSHSSGLPSGIRGAELSNPVASYLANQGRVRDLAAAITGLRLTHGPGEKVVYSNPGYNVAGVIAATATRQPFEVAARERVLGPLGMRRSDFVPERSGPGVATHYGGVLPPRAGTRPAKGPRLIATPMGGLTSNVLELARFGRMVLGGGALEGRRVLGAETIGAATALQARNHPGLGQGYGSGFRVRTWRGRRLLGHDGNMPGVASQLLLAPDDGIGVVVLTNGYSLAVPHEVAELTLTALLGLPPEQPGSEPDDDSERSAWVELGERVAGTYRLVDAAPPGAIGRANDAMTRVRVVAESAGRLRLDGNPGSDGPAELLPDGPLGHYRVVAPVEHGTDAVIEQRDDGVHLWLGHITHLHRRPRRGRVAEGRRAVWT